MNKKTILIIDDDQTLLDLLSEHLQMVGYMPLLAEDGSRGLQAAFSRQPDLIVLDVMMPGMDGWEVCERLRDVLPVPIIMLTAKGEEVDKLRGFHLGVDDYVTKPFSFAELVARVGAVLARASRPAPSGYEVKSGDLVVDFMQRRILVRGDAVDLTPTEYHLIEILARHAGRPVPTDALLREVWGPEYVGEPDHVKRYVWALRKKIESDPGNPQHILTERGFGYRFE
jgi:two-component system KDP operon response regulator KdpE